MVFQSLTLVKRIRNSLCQKYRHWERLGYFTMFKTSQSVEKKVSLLAFCLNVASSLNTVCKIRQNIDVCISDSSMTLCGANIVVCLRSFCKSLKLSAQFSFNPQWHKARSAGVWQEGWGRFQSWKRSDPGAVQVFSCSMCAQITGSVWISVTH